MPGVAGTALRRPEGPGWNVAEPSTAIRASPATKWGHHRANNDGGRQVIVASQSLAGTTVSLRSQGTPSAIKTGRCCIGVLAQGHRLITRNTIFQRSHWPKTQLTAANPIVLLQQNVLYWGLIVIH